jgi:hypothetical protein
MQLCSRETVLEAGFALFTVGFLVGFATLLAGRVQGNAARRRRHRETAPDPGSIPGERHQQLASPAR